jgi:protoporphyrinogen oxidase
MIPMDDEDMIPTLPRVSATRPASNGELPQSIPDSTSIAAAQREKHVVIMGAGPAGLTAAYDLLIHNGIPVTVLEKDPVYVGGISRTATYHGNRFDIGGHRFFSKSKEIEDLWTEILGDEMLVRPRLSRILYNHKFFDYPLKASNALFNLGPIETARCIASYVKARMFPVKNPKSFAEWTSNQFGKRLFGIFFKTYTERLWGISSDELSADWAAQRIKGLNMAEAIKNALFPPKKGKKGDALIKTLIEEFRYPRYGPGQMWERVQQMLSDRGYPVLMGQEVVSIRHGNGQVNSLVTRDLQGNLREYRGTDFISTLPVRELVNSFDPSLPPEVRHAANNLKYRDYYTVVLTVNKPNVFPDNWIYLHDKGINACRIQNYKNWSPAMVSNPNQTCLGLEYFCFDTDDVWTMPDAELIARGTQDVVTLGMCKASDIVDGVVVRMPKAYPIYDDEYKTHLRVIRDYLEAHVPNLQLVGRNGMHHYNNQDHSMMTALCAARNIAYNAGLDPWSVNTDAEYHEGSRDEEDNSGRQMPKRAQTAGAAH